MTELDRKNLMMLLKEVHSKELSFCEETLFLKYFTSDFKMRNLGIDCGLLATKIRKEKDCFSLIKDDKVYSFTLASDEKIKLTDKIILNFFNKKQNDKIILRTLDLACSKNFDDSKVIIASSKDNNLTIFMEFIRNNQPMIFDYVNNVVMKKVDYYELFDVEVISEIEKEKLYSIWKLWKEHNIPLYYLLFFTKEIFRDLEKSAPWLLEEYGNEGMYENNSGIMFLHNENKIKKQNL